VAKESIGLYAATELKRLQSKSSERFVNWLPTNLMASVCNVLPARQASVLLIFTQQGEDLVAGQPN